MLEPGDQPPSRHLQSQEGTVEISAIVRPFQEDDDDRGDQDLLPLFFAAWIASAVRVIGAVLDAEIFGAEPTMALLFVLGMPCLLKDELKSFGRRFLRGV